MYVFANLSLWCPWVRFSISVNYNRWKLHFVWDFTQTVSVFPCGRAQHVYCMSSSIASVINSILKFRSALFLLSDTTQSVVLTSDNSYILIGNVSCLFSSAKNSTVTVCILWIYFINTHLSYIIKETRVSCCILRQGEQKYLSSCKRWGKK